MERDDVIRGNDDGIRKSTIRDAFEGIEEELVLLVVAELSAVSPGKKHTEPSAISGGA